METESGIKLPVKGSPWTCNDTTVGPSRQLDTARGLTVGRPDEYLFADDVLVLFVLAARVAPTSVHDGGVHVGRTERVGLVQQRDHRQQDRPVKASTREQNGE